MDEMGSNNNIANSNNDDYHKMSETKCNINIANNKNDHNQNMSEMEDGINIANDKNEGYHNMSEMRSSYPKLNNSSLYSNSHTLNSLKSDHFTKPYFHLRQYKISKLDSEMGSNNNIANKK